MHETLESTTMMVDICVALRINRIIPKHLYIIFFNIKGYTCHFFISMGTISQINGIHSPLHVTKTYYLHLDLNFLIIILLVAWQNMETFHLYSGMVYMQLFLFIIYQYLRISLSNRLFCLFSFAMRCGCK